MASDAVELEVRGVVVGLFQENCWIVGSRRRGEACVIDPGDEPEEILAPGPTRGSWSLSAAAARLLFSGDTLFRESIGRTDLPGGNTEQILRSISQRLFALPDETRVLPGHMQETTIAHERAHNPFVRLAR